MDVLNSCVSLGLGMLVLSSLFYVICSDLAVRALYKEDRGTWDIVGKPVGFLWLPDGTRTKELGSIPGRRMRLPQALAEARKLSNDAGLRAQLDKQLRWRALSKAAAALGVCLLLAGIVGSLTRSG